MCAALIGGMARLKQDYIAAAAKLGVRLTVINGAQSGIAGRLGSPDLIILFTNKVSHAVRGRVMQVAKSKRIPVTQVHSCGVSTLRGCLRKA